jgi:hypothetical protein
MKLTRSALLLVALSGAAMSAPAPGFSAEAQPAASAASAASVSERLAALAEHYYIETARFEPVIATLAGDNRFDYLLPMTHSPAVRARQFAMLHDVQQSLMRIDRSKLLGTDLVTFDVLGFEVASALSFEPFRDYLLPMSQMDSVPVLVANLGSGQGSQPIATVAQYRAYLRRIEALPQWIDVAIADMRVGMKQGIVQPKALMAALLPQVKALAAASFETSDFSAPVRHFPESFSDFEKARLNAAYGQAVRGAGLPALRKLASFLETEYLPAAHHKRVGRPARRRQLVPRVGQGADHHRSGARRNPPHRPGRNGAHPGRICQTRFETGLQRRAARLAGVAGRATGEPPVQNRSAGTASLPRAERTD